MERLPQVLMVLSPLFGALGIADGARVIALHGDGTPALCVFGAISSVLCCLAYVRLRGPAEEEIAAEEEEAHNPQPER